MTPSPFRPKRLAAVVLAVLCASPAFAADKASPAPAGTRDFLQANLDTSVAPGKDFFEYANGGWLKAHPIPASEATWGIGNEVEDQLYASLRAINEKSAAGPRPAGSDAQKIGDFWATAMDTAKADRLGVHPLDEPLARIGAIASPKDAVDVAVALRPLSVDAFFSTGVYQDEKKSDAMAVHIGQGGLGLPERDFYFNPEKGVAKIREEYVAHMGRVLVQLGRDPAQAPADAQRVMDFETELAKASRKLEDLRDPQKNYFKMTPAELTAKDTPSMDWTAYLAGYGLHPETVIVGQPEYLAQLDAIVRKTPVPVLRDYLRLHLVDQYAAALGAEWDQEYFRFAGQVLQGQKEQRPRWKRVLDAEGSAMGMVLGRIFVAEYFPASAKKRYSDMVEAIRTAYGERIDRLDWMSPETKAKARQKLAAVRPKVGYPDKWKDYSKLVVGTDSYAQNLMNASRWAFDDNIAKFGKPVDRDEWSMTPQTYNAYYNPSNNEIVLPAAMFTVPGVPDALVDDAVAYGYVAAGTIGHEITHGFDDEGRQYDAAGNLTDWWTAEDAKRFNERAAVLAKEFDAYEPLPGLHINGKASLGENIADFGGLMLGLDAFKKTEQYRKGETIGGLTPMQRYFLGYALGWMSQQREERLRNRLLSDVHAPAKWRVLGPLSNIPEFYEAFGIRQGDAMWRPENERVHIW